MTDPRVTAFVHDLLLPTYAEIAASPRQGRDFSTHVYRDAVDDPIHAALVAELGVVTRGRDDLSLGPVILVEDRDGSRRPPPFGGRFLAAPTLRTATGSPDILVAPLVLYQMEFDGRLHAFQHRYAALAEVPVEHVTRVMILNHMLNSFTFFRMHALSPQRPW